MSKSTGKNGFVTHKVWDRNHSSFICFVPEYGGIITSLNVNGKEALYFNEDLLIEKDLNAGGVPFLFPVCGDLDGDIYSYEGKEYPMPSHGFARVMPLEPETGSDIVPGEIALSLVYGQETMKAYPFKFKVRLVYCICGNTLTIRQDYTNLGNEALPFYSGFHPYFLVADKHRLVFDLDADSYLDYNDNKVKRLSGYIDFDSEVDFVFKREKAKPYLCRMTDPDRRCTVEIQASEEYGALVLWTLKNKEFVCVEPWVAAPGAMNTGKGLYWLPAGKSCSFWFRILIHSD